MIDMVLPALQQWLIFAGFAFSVGCIAWRLVIAPRSARMLRAEHASALSVVERRVAVAGGVAALMLFGTWVLKMIVQVRGFRDPFVPLWDDVSFLLFETFWGTVWMAQGVIIPLLAVAFWRAGVANPDRGTKRASPALGGVGFSWAAATVLVLSLGATLALSSHAMGVESGRPFIVAADGAHAIAAGAWIGSLGLILTVGRATTGTDLDADLFAAQLRGFSPLAMVSVATLLSMGTVLAWTHLTALSDLWTGTYGRVLSAKIGGSAGVMALGFVNWRKGLPELGTEQGSEATRRRATREVWLAVGVLLLTAVLVHSPKP